MMIKISASVGVKAYNRAPDVLTIQQSLNRISSDRGGAADFLSEDSKIGPNTVTAILKFQKTQFGWADGRVDPGRQTITRIAEIINAETPNGQFTWPDLATKAEALERVLELLRVAVPKMPAGAGEWLSTLSPARLTAIEIALNDATPYPGRTSDLQTAFMVDPFEPITLRNNAPVRNIQRIRLGWRRLREYFDEGCPNFLKWDDPLHRQGIMYWNERVQAPGLPQAPGATKGVQWCGIFATWVYKRTQARWPMFRQRPIRWLFPLIDMPKITGLDHPGLLPVEPGDVGVIQKMTHHFVIISPVQKGKVWAVSGNADYQSIMVGQFKHADIRMRYRAEDIFR